MNVIRAGFGGKDRASAIAGSAASAGTNIGARYRELRDFGLITGGLFGAIFGLLLPLLHRQTMPWWPWVLTSVLALAALIRPALLHYFYLAWGALGKVLGWINTRVTLGLLFYVVMTPMGLMARMLGAFASHSSGTGCPDTYRMESRQITRESFEKPF